MWTQCLAYQCPRNYDGNGIVFVNLDETAKLEVARATACCLSPGPFCSRGSC